MCSLFLAKAEDGMNNTCYMAGHRVGESGLSDSRASNQHIAYGFLQGIQPPASTFYDQQESTFEFGELEEVLVPKLIRDDEHRKSLYTLRPPTLEIFPSSPMRFQQATPRNTVSCKGDVHAQLKPEYPITKKRSDHSTIISQQQKTEMASDAARAGPPNQPPKSQEKTLRRLAQNREAARKSRLRKKAYVQQLESSRVKLSQLEQELQRDRSQGLVLGGGGGGTGGNVSSGAAMFNIEYGRWLEENNRHMSELRGSLHAHLPDGNLRVLVDNCLAHYDDIFRIKGIAAKSDVFHLITGMWTTQAERCFLWMGGFRPSELIKIVMPQLDPLTEQQLVGICSLQQSSQQAEDALTQGLEQLQQSLADTVANGSLADGTHLGNYMGQMFLALGKLSHLEGFVYQADNLRQQTLHQIRQILTIRQAARCFLAIGDYYSRLRALSSLWVSRPRENMMMNEECSSQTTTTTTTTTADFHMIHHSHSHFPTLS